MMETSDKERRRLNALSFDILEREDGFRLELLVEFRNRAARNRRLLINELKRGKLIDKERHRCLLTQLNLEQSDHESSVIDHTLGEESYEDSVVDVAPLPRSSSPAPLRARKTLTQGSMYRQEREVSTSMDLNERSASDADLSDLDASSITLRPTEEKVEPIAGLLGAPRERRLTQPEIRAPNLVSQASTSALSDRQYFERLLRQTERLLEQSESPHHNELRIGIASHNAASLSFFGERISRLSQVARRTAALYEQLHNTLDSDRLIRWTQSFLSEMKRLFNPNDRITSSTGYTGLLVIRGGSGMGELRIERLDLKNGLLQRTPVSIELSPSDDPKSKTCAGSILLPQGWYEINYRQGDLCTRLQQFVIGDFTSTLDLPSQLNDTRSYEIIHAGPALLGDVNEAKQMLPFRIYSVASFLLAKRRVTHAEYFKFLAFIGKTQGNQAAARRSPRSAPRGGYRWPELNFSNQSACEKALGSLSSTPVTGISFHDARAYCHWLNIETGAGHRLPTEVEWEKAVRGCLATSWPWGNRGTSELDTPGYPNQILDGTSEGLEWTSSSGEDARYRVVRGCNTPQLDAPYPLTERVFLPEEQVRSNVGIRVARSFDV